MTHVKDFLERNNFIGVPCSVHIYVAAFPDATLEAEDKALNENQNQNISTLRSLIHLI